MASKNQFFVQNKRDINNDNNNNAHFHSDCCVYS